MTTSTSTYSRHPLSSNVCYLELSLCRTFYLVPSALSLTSLINPFDISFETRLSQTFTMSNNFLGSFRNFWAVSHRLSRTFNWGFRMNHTVHFRHSNVNNCIDKTLFGSLFFLFFNILSGNNMFSVKWQLSVRSLGEICQALRELEKGLSNKDVAEKYGIPKNTISTWIENKSKYFAALEQSSNKKKELKYSDYERVDHI